MEAINFYDVDGVAQLFRCNNDTVYKMIADEELTGAKIGKGYVFAQDDVMAAYRKRKQKAMKAAKPGRPRNPVPEIES